MKIYIPTYNRYMARLAQALWIWPKDLPVFVVVRPEELERYEQLLTNIGLRQWTILPFGQEGVMLTRNAILDHATGIKENRIFILDDDINFLRRKDDHAWKLRGATDEEVIEMFNELTEALTDYAHVGVSGREGNNRVLDDWVENTRIIRFIGLRMDVLNKHGIRYRLHNREDFDLTLRLLSLGCKNRVYYKYAQGQKESGMAGGLSGSPVREPEAMAANAHELADLHPGLVKVVQKKTKTSFGGGTRTDVICYWKKAYERAVKTGEIPSTAF